ncbi:High mobility group protein 20A [Orbilia brochopaga]|uniref:High mobility group protein 20A n=1 Tax=Orbilia brochopaga TaxID=3140254 RepID=A0AAV9U6Q5_9PEZI
MAHGAKSAECLPKKTRQAHNNKVPPDAPRRNLSSFVMFANVRRKELKERFPDRSFPDIQSDISNEWAKMDDDSKTPWKQAMTDDKERYKREMELYRKHGPHWVWVVGHKMRLGLGLTDEDCTQLQWDASAEPRGDLGPSSRVSQDYNKSGGKPDPRCSSKLPKALLPQSPYTTVPHGESAHGDLSGPESFLDPRICADVHTAKKSRSESVDIPRRNQHANEELANHDGFGHDWSPEWAHAASNGETPYTSYVADWFCLDPEWQDNYQWGD